MSDSTKDKTGRRSRGSMAPPPSTTSSGAPSIHPAIREITEDTPPDLLEGAMELLVVLPSTKTIKINVERRTPMMDLLIHIGTINKLNPGDHIVQVRNERGIELPYKPSTPIGTLDTNIIEIVPKNRVSEYIIVKKPAKVANQPFEHTFRLQVHLPRNQLYVMRVSMLAILGDILKEVCQEKNLDINKYEVRHPGNLDERLPLHASLGECGLQSITVVSKNTKISNSVSTADILALQQTDEGRGKGYLDSSFKHSRSSVGDSSVSSGSTRSDKSDRSVSPFPINSSAKISRLQDCTSSADVNHPRAVHKSVSMSNMFSPGSASAAGVQPPPRQKKRAAPPPPPLLKSQTESPLSICAIENDTKETPRKKEAPRAPIVKTPLTSSALQLNQSTQSNHSRHNSENCGYNEDTSVLTKYEYDRQTSAPALLSKQTTARSASNLTTTSSVSNTSLASSTGGSKKRRAPVPPSIPVLRTQSEIEEEDLSEASCLPEVSSSPSKPEKSSCQSSVQVEVDVHYRKNSISVNTSNKEEDNYSSTPASSLSSPGSYISTSSTSSPLPRTESPLCDSKPISLPSRSSIPIDNINSNYSADSDTPCKMQPSEEPVGSTQVPAPLPPPRTKVREDSLEEITTQAPKPKPRPRPDRKSTDNNSDPIIEATVKVETQQPPPAYAPQLRNPLSKFGVKVLPDNVLKERAERLAASKASADLEESYIATPTKKAVAPPPPVSKVPKVKPPIPPSSKNSAFNLQKKDSNSSTQSESDAMKPRDDLKKFMNRKSASASVDEDSDDLEENLELFEPTPTTKSKNVQNVKLKAKAPPIPVSKQLEAEPVKPRVISSSVSDFQDFEKKSTTQLSPEADKGLARTSSDRIKKEAAAEDGNLNRWQNLESLHEIGDSSDASKRTTNNLSMKVEGFPNTSTSKFTKRSDLSHHNNSSKQSSSGGLHDAGLQKDSHHDEVDDAGLTSSESEVSYTDSGVPTTETITPSPMDFDARISDHEEDDEPSKHQLNESRGSSNRSSFQSDEEDQWRNVLKEKSMNSLEAQEKTFASMIPQSFETEKNTDKLLSNNEKQSHSTQEKVESGNSSRSSSDSLPPRKLSKAESFSHNSEFDFVQMKRKQFVSGQGKTIDKKRGHSSTDLASSSHHSSSEEDLIRRIDSSHQQNRPRESDSDDYRTISMQNLNTNSSTKEKVEGVQLRNKEGRSSSSIQKSQSLIAIQNTDPEISNNPDLMKAQLEAQFEQWKKDFLKQQEASSVSGQSNTVEPVLDNKHSEIPVETTEMDFVVPIANHSNPKVVAAETEVLPRTFVNIESNVTSSISISSEEPTGILPTEYKYSGPPTIKIGSYTPRTNISVKKDEDYIMGYGQANPKGSPATQSKPATKTRPHSYTPNVAMQKFAPEPLTMVTMRSVVENVTHPNKPIINNSPRGISAILNARPASSYIEEENEESSTQGSVKSVLSTWKQRVADYGSEKKFPEGPPPEIDLYGGGDSTYNYLTSTPSSNLKNVREDKKADVIISNEPKMKIVDGGTTNFSLSKDKFNQSKSFNQPIPTTIISTEQPERKQETNFSKTVFSIAVMESKPAQKPPNKFEASTLKEEIITPTKSENVALRKTQITLELSPSENENNLSLKERKKYFQGIQPVESPGKETPLPAVNMQSSIATIQKVFQQRQQHAPVQRSMTLPSKSNNNVVVEPETTQSSQTPQITTVHTSSTMPKQFQAAMSSTEMVQRVLGKSSKTTHDAFRKTPSPISSTTSTLSRESSSGRETPSSVNEEIVNVRVSNEAKKSEINTHNEGDKSLVIVIGSDTTNKPSPKPITPIGSNNMFKILNNKNATPTKTHFGESSVKRTNSINSTTIIINGNSEKDRRGSKSEKPIVVEQINKSFNNPMAKLKNEGNGPPPPPPPPPNFNIPITRPSEISLKGRPQSVALSSPSSKDSTPSSPNSDPRSEIFSAIKQSNGNFGLKKTGSTFLLK